MPKRSTAEFAYQADIEGGDFPMSGLRAPAQKPGDWRVVIIPGAPSKYLLFRRLLAEAPPELDMTVIMRAGYGASRLGPRAPVLNFDDQVRAIAPVLTAAEGRKTLVMGVSYGGALALKAALDHSDHVDAVLTCAMLVDEPRAHARAAVAAGGLPGLERVLPDDAFMARREVAGRRRQIGPLFNKLREIKQPVAILHGDRDHLVHHASAERLKGMFPDQSDVSLNIVRGGTHYLECERPTFILTELAGLMARADARRPALA